MSEMRGRVEIDAFLGTVKHVREDGTFDVLPMTVRSIKPDETRDGLHQKLVIVELTALVPSSCVRTS